MRLPHTVTVTTPVYVSDAHGNQIPDYTAGTARVLAGWMQYRTGRDVTDNRDAVVGGWVLYTYSIVDARDQVTWDGRTFIVRGDVKPASRPDGSVHHYETALESVEG